MPAFCTGKSQTGSVASYPKIHGLEVDDPEQWSEKGVPCPVPAGGVTLHASYMLHYAGANETESPRRAYILAFRKPPTKLDVTVDNYWVHTRKTAREERARIAAQN